MMLRTEMLRSEKLPVAKSTVASSRFGRRSAVRVLSVAFLASMVISFGNATAEADWKDDIGYTALLARIGGGLENGAGVKVAMGEALSGGKYMPNPGNGQFTGKTLTDITGTNGNTTYSTHATTVGQYFFGNTASIAGGITDVDVYLADSWALDVTGYSTGTDPAVPNYSIINHSWVARSGDISLDEATGILYRVDSMVEKYDTMVIGGVDNSGALPRLLAPSYNSIVVGKSNGTHSSGTTPTFYGPGRAKPDLVAPGTATSWATPMVSSATALLYQKGSGTDAVRSETLRAVLLAGATKDEFADWDHTTTRPLDDVYGAGELNVDNSYRILEGGQFAGSSSEPGSAVGSDGWDYQASFDSSGSMYYDFIVADGMQATELSVLLAWNAEVQDLDETNNFDPVLNLANFDLRLYDSTDSFLGTLLDSSVSTIDNVEHLYQQGLAAGRYTIQVTGDQNWDYALAWRSSFQAVPEPGAGMILSAAMIALGLYRRRR